MIIKTNQNKKGIYAAFGIVILLMLVSSLDIFSLFYNFSLVEITLILLLIISITLLIVRQSKEIQPKENNRPVPPSDLSIMEMSLLTKGRLSTVDIVAGLYQAGSLGMIQFFKNQNDLYLFRPQYCNYNLENRTDLARLIDILVPINEHGTPFSFKKTLQTMNKDLFSELVNNLYREVYGSLTKKHLVLNNTRQNHLLFKTIAIIIKLVGVFEMIFGLSTDFYHIDSHVLIGAAIFCIGHILYNHSHEQMQYSEKGLQSLQEIANFYSYITSPKKIGIEGRQGYLFWQYLPYAIVFGKSQRWLDRFNEISFVIPKWYSGLKEIFIPEEFVNEVLSIEKILGENIALLVDPNIE